MGSPQGPWTEEERCDICANDPEPCVHCWQRRAEEAAAQQLTAEEEAAFENAMFWTKYADEMDPARETLRAKVRALSARRDED